MQRLQAVVRGRVQGVGFRYSVLEMARGAGLRGFAENKPDGSVFVVAEGRPDQLDDLEKFLHRGPSFAHVTGVEADRSAATGEFGAFVAH
jgi:acylphosphatase